MAGLGGMIAPDRKTEGRLVEVFITVVIPESPFGPAGPTGPRSFAKTSDGRPSANKSRRAESTT